MSKMSRDELETLISWMNMLFTLHEEFFESDFDFSFTNLDSHQLRNLKHASVASVRWIKGLLEEAGYTRLAQALFDLRDLEARCVCPFCNEKKMRFDGPLSEGQLFCENCGAELEIIDLANEYTDE